MTGFRPEDHSALMWPLSWLYAGGRIAHRSLYTLGIKERHRLDRPVICVGNMTVGGTGKTSFIMELANNLMERGRHPVVLSRGYGAEPPAERPRIVSDGEKVLLTPEAGGDEPVLIGRCCPGVPVVIGARRHEAGELASRTFDPDLFLLDDGYQHEALDRRADIVLWDLRDRPSAMRQLPAGRLREGLWALRRATVLILTHGESLADAERERRTVEVIEQIKRHAPSVPIFEAASYFTDVRSLTAPLDRESPRHRIETLRGKKVVLVSGLARPEGFETMAVASGMEIVDHLRHEDHARYSHEDLKRMEENRERTGADLILTTEKDAIKLESLAVADIPIFAVGLRMRVTEPARWEPLLAAILNQQG